MTIGADLLREVEALAEEHALGPAGGGGNLPEFPTHASNRPAIAPSGDEAAQAAGFPVWATALTAAVSATVLTGAVAIALSKRGRTAVRALWAAGRRRLRPLPPPKDASKSQEKRKKASVSSTAADSTTTRDETEEEDSDDELRQATTLAVTAFCAAEAAEDKKRKEENDDDEKEKRRKKKAAIEVATKTSNLDSHLDSRHEEPSLDSSAPAKNAKKAKNVKKAKSEGKVKADEKVEAYDQVKPGDSVQAAEKEKRKAKKQKGTAPEPPVSTSPSSTNKPSSAANLILLNGPEKSADRNISGRPKETSTPMNQPQLPAAHHDLVAQRKRAKTAAASDSEMEDADMTLGGDRSKLGEANFFNAELGFRPHPGDLARNAIEFAERSRILQSQGATAWLPAAGQS